MRRPCHGKEMADRPTAMPELAAHPNPPRDKREDDRTFPIPILVFSDGFRIYPIGQ